MRLEENGVQRFVEYVPDCHVAWQCMMDMYCS
jgi:hypothetical protein